MTSASAGSEDLPSRVSAAELLARIDGQPRVRLGHFPTPLEELPRLSEALGGPRILVKRDDLTGLAFGGNKTRTLEYVLGDLLIRQPEVLVTGANIQSNWSRRAAAASAKPDVPERGPRQRDAAGVTPTHIWAAAAGPTQSGLVLGAKAVRWEVACPRQADPAQARLRARQAGPGDGARTRAGRGARGSLGGRVGSTDGPVHSACPGCSKRCAARGQPQADVVPA